ncbi:hypothetical protein H5410_003726 [Solanum commersonii]|uniref:Uncharacterized protein n=1 Tax=Solanum commersonii TaxID=4109 RepID=A0A9J6B5Q6_SOLCO|nr:hypothetical protein H5410_003726 [Solanum commersonii]
MQFAAKGVLLEDIRDADPLFYQICKEILNMDAEIMDQDVLNLKFVEYFSKGISDVMTRSSLGASYYIY